MSIKLLKRYVEISVIDRGQGISAKEQTLIFSPFYRIESLILKNPEGTGLGLTIAQLFIKRMGGTIGVKSKKNKGSRFRIKLPIKKNSKKFTYLIRR